MTLVDEIIAVLEPLAIQNGLELVTADVIFSATGVTNGSIVKGLRREPHFVETETILMRSKTGSVRRMIYRNPNLKMGGDRIFIDEYTQQVTSAEKVAETLINWKNKSE